MATCIRRQLAFGSWLDQIVMRYACSLERSAGGISLLCVSFSDPHLFFYAAKWSATILALSFISSACFSRLCMIAAREAGFVFGNLNYVMN